MEAKTVAEINQYTGSSVNPLEYPEQLFEVVFYFSRIPNIA